MDSAWIGVIASLGGVLIGGGLALAEKELAWRRSERRSRADEQARREEALRSVCVQVATHAEQIRSHAWSFADYRLQDPAGWRTDPYVQALQDKLEDVIVRFDTAMNTLRVLRAGAFVDLAERLDDTVRGVVDQVFAAEPELPTPIVGEVVAFLAAVADEVAQRSGIEPPATARAGVRPFIGRRRDRSPPS